MDCHNDELKLVCTFPENEIFYQSIFIVLVEMIYRAISVVSSVLAGRQWTGDQFFFLTSRSSRSRIDLWSSELKGNREKKDCWSPFFPSSGSLLNHFLVFVFVFVLYLATCNSRKIANYRISFIFLTLPFSPLDSVWLGKRFFFQSSSTWLVLSLSIFKFWALPLLDVVSTVCSVLCLIACEAARAGFEPATPAF